MSQHSSSPLQDVLAAFRPDGRIGTPPVPRASDRAFWTGLSPEVSDGWVARAETARNQGVWPSSPLSGFLDYRRDGDRSRFEGISFGKRSRLVHLLIGEVLKGEGTFVPALADGLWSIAEETTWVVPAHWDHDTNAWLPVDGSDGRLPNVDLFAAATASVMAWTLYLHRDALEVHAPGIVTHLRERIASRCLRTFFERNDLWWMGFTEKRVNNWNPWIVSNLLAAGLLAAEELPPADREAERLRFSRRSVQLLDSYMNAMPEDGGCDEGPGYWNAAGASLFDCLELLEWGLGGDAGFYRLPKIKAIVRFPLHAHLAGHDFVNFADGSRRPGLAAELVERAGRKTEQPELSELGRHFQGSIPPHLSGAGWMLSRFLRDLMFRKNHRGVPAPLPLRSFLPDLQQLTCREVAGSEKGWVLAAKGGHNAESHNHNDVGHFVASFDGAPVFIDAGVESYTRFTFSERRYEIWTMQSAWHSLPHAPDWFQMPGEDFSARSVRHEAAPDFDALHLDLAGAYSGQGAEFWKRSLLLQRGGKARIEVREEWRFSVRPEDLRLHYLFAEKPVIEGDEVRIPLENGASVRLSWSGAPFALEAEERILTDENLKKAWGRHALHRLILRLSGREAAGSLRMTVVAGPASSES